MRLPRVRLTVRWMMVAVAIVAAILAAYEAGRRWEAARVGVHGPGVTVVQQRKGAAASEPIQPPDGQKQCP